MLRLTILIFYTENFIGSVVIACENKLCFKLKTCCWQRFSFSSLQDKKIINNMFFNSHLENQLLLLRTKRRFRLIPYNSVN